MLMLHWIVQGGAEPILIGENNLLEQQHIISSLLSTTTAAADKQVGEYSYISVTTTTQ